jgi:glutaconate CoA-transferase subunit A
MTNKTISLSAAADLVKTGDMLALGGMTLYRRPMAFVRSLLKRHRDTNEPNDLTLFAFTAGLESDLLVGSGMIAKIRTCYFGLEIFGLAPMFTYLANRGLIEIIEETEASIAFGLRAQMAGIKFMPGRGWLGTDLPELRPDVRTVIDPYSGEELMAFPAIKSDIVVIHALRADWDGNAQIGKNKSIDEDLVLTAETVLITAEEIVPELEVADLLAPWVDAVVHTPGGAAPTSCHPLYGLNGEEILAYVENVSDSESWGQYVEQILGKSINSKKIKDL